MNVQFYHLTSTPLDRALPKLLEKAFSAGLPTLVVTGSEEQTERLNQLLWTYDPNSFLPHGSAKEGAMEKQPIYLSAAAEPKYHARAIVVTDGSIPEASATAERLLDIFDGRDKEAVEKARSRWSLYKSGGHTITYLRQTEQGGWENKTA